jgi:molecular chaperone DnaK
MKKDAEAHAEEDKKKKELIEVRNMADTLIYTTEKALRDAGDKITADEKKPIEEKIEALKKVKDGDDLEAIKKATEEMSLAAQKIGEKLYKAAAEAQAAQTPPADAKPEDSVKDAETKEETKEEDKKE